MLAADHGCTTRTFAITSNARDDHCTMRRAAPVDHSHHVTPSATATTTPATAPPLPHEGGASSFRPMANSATAEGMAATAAVILAARGRLWFCWAGSSQV